MQARSFEYELPQAEPFDDGYDDDYDDSDDVSLMKEMLNAGIPRRRVKEFFTGKIKESKLDNILDDSPSRKDGNKLHSSHQAIVELVRQAKAPEDFVDPLFLQLMTDPVVLSSGYIVDRSTVIDEDGNLKFSRCPFTRKVLRLEVYPATEKRMQIEKFKARRDHAISNIARKLIAEGKYRSFHDVLDAVEDYLKSTGDVNYLPLARELANIWSGFHESCPILLIVESIDPRRSGDKWHCALRSAPLEEKIRKMLVSIESLVQKGRGFQKPHLSIVLYNENGVLLERVLPFEASQHSRMRLRTHKMFEKSDPIISKARRGHYYQLEYLIENSNGTPIDVGGWMCKLFPSNLTQPSYRMRDGDGLEGLYMGKVDVGEAAHGKGVLEYDDGKRFVGKFHHGSMVDGVLYRGSHTRFTMRKGKWSRVVDRTIIDEYPANIIVYDNGCSHRDETEEEYTGAYDDNFSQSRETKHQYHRASDFSRIGGRRSKMKNNWERRRYIVDDEYSDYGTSVKEDEDRHNSNTQRHFMTRDSMRDSGNAYKFNHRTSRRSEEQIDPRKGIMMQQKRSEKMEKYDRREFADFVNESERLATTGSVKSGGASVLGSMQSVRADRAGLLLSTKQNAHSEDVSEISLSEFSRHNNGKKETSLSELPRYKEPSLPQLVESDFHIEKPECSKSISSHGDSQSTILFVDQFRKEAEGGKWMTLVQSRCLRNEISSIITSVELFTDQKSKSMIGLALYDERGEMVERCNLFSEFRKESKTDSFHRVLDRSYPVVSKAAPGFFYRLEYAIGLNAQDTINIQGLFCKIFPDNFQEPSYRMSDPEGDEGFYMGTVDMDGRANGRGSLEYDNGCTFLGTFKSGMMMSGVHYRGKEARFTMKNSRWTKSLDATINRQYPFRGLLLEGKSTPQSYIYKDSDEGDEEKSLLQKFCASYE